MAKADHYRDDPRAAIRLIAQVLRRDHRPEGCTEFDCTQCRAIKIAEQNRRAR